MLSDRSFLPFDLLLQYDFDEVATVLGSNALYVGSGERSDL